MKNLTVLYLKLRVNNWAFTKISSVRVIIVTTAPTVTVFHAWTMFHICNWLKTKKYYIYKDSKIKEYLITVTTYCLLMVHKQSCVNSLTFNMVTMLTQTEDIFVNTQVVNKIKYIQYCQNFHCPCINPNHSPNSKPF